MTVRLLRLRLALDRPLDGAERRLKELGRPFGARRVFDVGARVDDGELAGPGRRRRRGESRQLRELRALDDEKRVLRVPPLHVWIRPDAGPQAVDERVAALTKQRRPVVRPLLVEVVVATLKRDRG